MRHWGNAPASQRQKECWKSLKKSFPIWCTICRTRTAHSRARGTASRWPSTRCTITRWSSRSHSPTPKTITTTSAFSIKHFWSRKGSKRWDQNYKALFAVKKGCGLNNNSEVIHLSHIEASFNFFFKNGPFPASFSLFSSIQCSWQ